MIPLTNEKREEITIEAARVACGVMGRSKPDQSKTGLETFREVYEYLKKDFEESITGGPDVMIGGYSRECLYEMVEDHFGNPTHSSNECPICQENR